MSHKAQDWAWEMPVAGVRKYVLLAIAERANARTGMCTPSLPELAARTGIAASTVRAHIRVLESMGLVQVDVTHGGRRQRSTYTLPVGKPASSCAETHRQSVGNESETHREPVVKTHRQSAAKTSETHREPSTNPPGAGAVVLRTNTRTREPGSTTAAAAPVKTDESTDGLFAAPAPRPSKTMTVVGDRTPSVNGGTAVAAWCDGYRESFPGCEPTQEQTGRIGRAAKQLLKAGNAADRVVYAAWSAGSKGSVHLQSEFQHLSQRGARTNPQRVGTTDQRVNEHAAVIAFYEGRETG